MKEPAGSCAPSGVFKGGPPGMPGRPRPIGGGARKTVALGAWTTPVAGASGVGAAVVTPGLGVPGTPLQGIDGGDGPPAEFCVGL
jgi:hypothetical protein